MPSTDYKPQVGEQIFVSLSGNAPILITVTGFHYHSYLKKDVMDFRRRDGSTSWTDPDGQAFFPEIPTDTPYLYVLVLHQDFEDAWGYAVDEGYFFAAQDAFDLRDAILSGDAQSKHGGPADRDDFVVEVREVS